MWFLNYIIQWLDSATGYFYDAYQEVIGWVWPFYLLYLPLYYLYRAFYYITYYFGQFNEWLAWAASRIDAILSTWDIWSYFQTWFDYGIDAWTWVVNAVWNVWNIVEDWWSSAKYLVLSWIDTAKYWLQVSIDAVSAGLTQLKANLQWFFDHLLTFDEIIQWWKNWLGRVLAAMLTWGFIRALDIVGLIATAFIERDDFWAGWQEWRGMVAAFFDDPLEFLWELATDWFIGPEE